MDFKKINLKQQKYILPLIALPFILFLGFQGSKFMGSDDAKKPPQQELSVSLGETQDSILSKNDAYDKLFSKTDGRTMLDGLQQENDSLNQFTDNLEYRQKRYIDSLNESRKSQISETANQGQNSYYKPKTSDDGDFQRSKDIIRMLNQEGSGGNSNNTQNVAKNTSPSAEDAKALDPVKMMRQQMLVLDSLEKSRDPEFQAQLKAQELLKKNKEKMDAFLNSTYYVAKSNIHNGFNSIYREKEGNFVKAVIDENLTGFLGSRIRFRLLEDVFAGGQKLPKGTVLYGQISGFSLQRVNLNVVSVMRGGEILPINLTVYDTDGMQGLYVPNSTFREMLRELGSNSVQGTNIDSEGKGFYTSLLSGAFRSASQTAANLIRTNKAKLKYNSYIFLINEKDLKQNTNQP